MNENKSYKKGKLCKPAQLSLGERVAAEKPKNNEVFLIEDQSCGVRKESVRDQEKMEWEVGVNKT